LVPEVDGSIYKGEEVLDYFSVLGIADAISITTNL
jgi:hypothetical protein